MSLTLYTIQYTKTVNKLWFTSLNFLVFLNNFEIFLNLSNLFLQISNFNNLLKYDYIYDLFKMF